jgi:hypothetical protein
MMMNLSRGAPVVLACLLAVTLPSRGVAQAAVVPFGIGERAVYGVWYGGLGRRGEATTTVRSVETVSGRPAYHLVFTLNGGIPFARIDDRMESWLDTERLHAHRFRQELHQVRYRRSRTLEFLPAQGLWRDVNDPTITGLLPTDLPLDEIAFLFWSRTLPLEVGHTYVFNRYYRESGNPVVLKVLRRERISVPAGTFNTIVIQPVIRTSGLFADGGEAEVYLTDDARRLIVQVRTRLRIGTAVMRLEHFTPGTHASR